MKIKTPVICTQKSMFTSNEHSRGILYERCYFEVDEKRVVETAGHIQRQNIHGIVYNRQPQDDSAYHVDSMAIIMIQNDPTH